MKKIFEDMVPNNNRKSIRDVAIPDRSTSRRINVLDVSNQPTSTSMGTSTSSDTYNTATTATSSSSFASLYGAQLNTPSQSTLSARNNLPIHEIPPQEEYRSAPSRSIPPVYPTNYPERNSRKRSNHFFLIFFAGILLLIGGGLLAWTFVFPKVEIDIVPLSQDITLNAAQFSAQKGSPLLGYTIATLSEEGVKKVAPSGERQVRRTATGKVTLYNAYTTKTQRLVRNTRLETPKGLIFRISDSVTIPGKTVTNGTETPGSITVDVVADTPGDAGNIAASDFTIPGFKGDPRYTKFYGRSVGAMAGGFIGTEKVVSDDILASTQDTVRTETITKLTEQIRKGLTSNQVIFADGIYSETEMLPGVEDGNMVAVKAKVTLYAVVFEKDALAKSIATANITPFDNSPVTLENLDELKLSIINKEQVKPWIDTALNFTLNGKTRILWTFDENKLKSALVGQPKVLFYKTILPSFTSIAKATPHFSPVWRGTFPDTPEAISIRVVDK